VTALRSCLDLASGEVIAEERRGLRAIRSARAPGHNEAKGDVGHRQRPVQQTLGQTEAARYFLNHPLQITSRGRTPSDFCVRFISGRK